MKYITFEKSEFHHNLFKHTSHTSLVSYWIYDVYEIDCELNQLPKEIQQVCIELSEQVAKSSWFAHINLDERKTMNVKVENQIFEWVKDSLNIPKNKKLNPRDKFTYNITEQDEYYAVEFIKTILLDYLEKHYNSLSDGNKARYKKKIDGIRSNIHACKTNHECHIIMHNHFNYPLLVVENKLGKSLPGAQWNLSLPSKKTEVEYFTPEMVDAGPTIDNISPEVFELKWEIGEPVLVNI